MMLKKSDDAISPVIGVMLMMVITVIIAAVITGFTTGLVTNSEPAPTAVLDVKIDSKYKALEDYGNTLFGPDFQIIHISGDPLDTADLEIRLSWTDDYCGKYHYSTYSAAKFAEQYPGGIDSCGGMRYQPMYMKSTESGGTGYGGLDHYFGEAILTPGSKMTSTVDFLDCTWMGVVYTHTGSQFMDVIFDNGQITCDRYSTPYDETTGGIMNHLEIGTVVNVMIIHIPSNSIIYENEVSVTP
ncbi:MAG: type IV pilin N-terminal domain-containing protein [Methanocorpusculum sp.]|nr:type IV pilin N-terminal domain-containing protein [Methanocorpusculum sp.]